MIKNADITIFNLRVGSDRREKFFATKISGVFWYDTKGMSPSGNDRSKSEQYIIRIPVDAVVEGGRTYISEEKYKKLSDEEAERHWTIQKGAYVAKEQYEDAGKWKFDPFSFRNGVITEVSLEDLKSLRALNEDFATITEYADNTVRGTKVTQHWRIGGS